MYFPLSSCNLESLNLPRRSMIIPTDGPKVKVDCCSFPRGLLYIRKLEVPLSHGLPTSLDSVSFILGNEHHSLVTPETLCVHVSSKVNVCLPLVVSTTAIFFRFSNPGSLGSALVCSLPRISINPQCKY